MRNALLNTVAAAGLLMAGSSAIAGVWVPANPPQGSQSMLLFGINDNNIVTGAYVDSSGVQRGFVGPFDGSKYKSFDDSGGVTEPRSLNDKKLITGYDTGTLVPWERLSDGTLTDVTKNGAPLNQIAQGININGVFSGNYLNSKGVSVGYLGKKSKYTDKFKLTISNSGYAGRAINTAGDIAGWYYDPSTGLQRGFAIVGGKAKGIDYPNAAYTVMEGLNDNGVASGQYQDSSGVIHGFIYDLGTKTFTSLEAPGASLTQAWGISNNNVVAVSADIGSFVYCIKKGTCPQSAGAFRTMQHISGKYTPARP
jgi:hypothetical protein